MLIDVHGHFYHERTPYPDWRQRNASRIELGRRVGVTHHVASILGSWGRTSPTYFPSPDDVVYGNDRMLDVTSEYGRTVRAYVTVNPNFTEHAVAEMERCVTLGAVGLKLAASRRATDRLLDPVIETARRLRLPVLHHVWQHRRRDWPGQEASDGAELCQLALRHPEVNFILAHIGGGGDWRHSLTAAADVSNVFIDLSGSGVDAGMLEETLDAAGPGRCLWGSDLTLDTAIGKLRFLERIGTAPADVDAIRYGNAQRIFPPGTFQ